MNCNSIYCRVHDKLLDQEVRSQFWELARYRILMQVEKQVVDPFSDQVWNTIVFTIWNQVREDNDL